MLKKLQELRIEKGWTNEYMAKELKISKAYYWQLENGNRRLYYETAKKIAKIFNLKPDDIFYDETLTK